MATSSAPSNNPTPTPTPTPILLLKSPSPSPTTDPYTHHLTTPSPTTTSPPSTAPHTYTPHFIPVLTHTLLPDPLIKLILAHLDRPTAIPFQYGALIFTSQRAVAAFSSALNAPPIQKHVEKLKKLRVRLYTVGPATAVALRGVRERLLPRCEIYGGEVAGSGEVLAGLMLGAGVEGYGERNEDGRGMKPVLFLTGETRRDVIPRMLMDERLGEGRVQVDEMVVYQTSELDEFEFHFSSVLRQTKSQTVTWVVVFSPTAGKDILRGLGWLDDRTGKAKKDIGERKTFVACIGPTTEKYLHKEFGFAADVVASKPSPQGIKDGIENFIRENAI